MDFHFFAFNQNTNNEKLHTNCSSVIHLGQNIISKESSRTLLFFWLVLRLYVVCLQIGGFFFIRTHTPLPECSCFFWEIVSMHCDSDLQLLTCVFLAFGSMELQKMRLQMNLLQVRMKSLSYNSKCRRIFREKLNAIVCMCVCIRFAVTTP